MVFNTRFNNFSKQPFADDAVKAFISTQTTVGAVIKSSKGIEFSQWTRNYVCYFLWTIGVYVAAID